MNKYVKRYKFHRNNGHDLVVAFGIIASSIAISGTFNDLKEVDSEFQKDLWNLEEDNNESTTRTVSAV